MTGEQTTLRVAAEYRAYPVWLLHPDGTDNPAPEELGLSGPLCRALEEWADDFDTIFPEDDPGAAAFASPDAEKEFNARGRALAQQVADEVGDRFRVVHLRSGGTDQPMTPRP